MKKNFSALAATVMLVSGFALATPVAAQSADGVSASSARPAGCVTKAEFGKAKKRMTVNKVAKVFGTTGKRESIATGGGYRFEIRSYKTCTPYGAITIGYSNGKLDNKFGIF